MKNLIQFSFRFTHDTSRLCLVRFGIGLVRFGFRIWLYVEGGKLERERQVKARQHTYVFKILSVDEKELFGCYKT